MGSTVGEVWWGSMVGSMVRKYGGELWLGSTVGEVWWGSMVGMYGREVWWPKTGIKLKFNEIALKKIIVTVLLSTSVERFGVSRMRDFVI